MTYQENNNVKRQRLFLKHRIHFLLHLSYSSILKCPLKQLQEATSYIYILQSLIYELYMIISFYTAAATADKMMMRTPLIIIVIQRLPFQNYSSVHLVFVIQLAGNLCICFALLLSFCQGLSLL